MEDIKVGSYVRCSFQPLTKGRILWIDNGLAFPMNRDVGVRVPDDNSNTNETYVFKAWQLEVIPGCKSSHNFSLLGFEFRVWEA